MLLYIVFWLFQPITFNTRLSHQVTLQKRCIQTSTAASGGGGEYSELSDYNLYLWDRPSGKSDEEMGVFIVYNYLSSCVLPAILI